MADMFLGHGLAADQEELTAMRSKSTQLHSIRTQIKKCHLRAMPWMSLQVVAIVK
jgi:hypothetical protein